MEKEELKQRCLDAIDENRDLIIQLGDDVYKTPELARASGSLAKHLRVTNGEPLFYLYSEIFDTDYNLVHICRDYIRGEQYRFYMDDYTRP